MSNLSLAYEVITKMLGPVAMAATLFGGTWAILRILQDKPIIEMRRTPTYVCYRHSIGAVKRIPFDTPDTKEQPDDLA